MDLFQIEQTMSPGRQWIELCKSAGVQTHRDTGGDWSAYFQDARSDQSCEETGASLDGYLTDAIYESETDAIHALHCLLVEGTGETPIFPTLDEWKLFQMRKP